MNETLRSEHDIDVAIADYYSSLIMLIDEYLNVIVQKKLRGYKVEFYEACTITMDAVRDNLFQLFIDTEIEYPTTELFKDFIEENLVFNDWVRMQIDFIGEDINELMYIVSCLSNYTFLKARIRRDRKINNSEAFDYIEQGIADIQVQIKVLEDEIRLKQQEIVELKKQ